MRFRPLLFIPLLWLSACAVGPDYKRPDVTLPDRFSEAGGEWVSVRPAEFKPTEQWWRVFGDGQLDRMAAQVAVDNQNLKAADAQYRAARAAVDSAAAGRFPTVSASAGASRGQSKGVTGNDFSLAASASWELDLWGRVRRTVEAAQAKAEASADDLAAATLSTRALLAQSWFQLRSDDLQIALMKAALEGDRRFLGLTRDRRAAGLASGLDVSQAESLLNTDRAQLSELELQRALLAHAINNLLGGRDAPATSGAELPAVSPVPALLPSTLLQRRPDIASAERQAAAANAQIGLAETAYFPVLDLAAMAGGNANTLGALFNVANRVWSVGPSLAMALFDGGARGAAAAQARAGYDQAVANYRQTVLNAFQEVQDNLATARLLQREAGEQSQALGAARRAREIAEAQYQAGTIDALNVITARNTELAAERNMLAIHSRQLAASVQLFKNLGGRAEAGASPAGMATAN